MRKDHSIPMNIGWKKLAQKFVQRSLIYRFKHMSGRKQVAKIIWFFLIICSIAVCSYQIYSLYLKWDSNPVIVTFDTKSTPIWKIPFPAVTICPQSKSNHSKFKLPVSFDKNKVSEEQLRSIYALAHLCDYNEQDDEALTSPVENSNVLNDLKEISLDEMNIFHFVSFMGFVEKRPYFYKMFTNEGICYSFNLLDYSLLFNDNIDETQKMPDLEGRYRKVTNWSLQEGYIKQAGYIRHSYPYHVHSAGVDNGLNLDLDALPADIDFKCNQIVDGYKLALHTPGEFPRLDQHYFQIPFGQYVMISIKPRVIKTSKNLLGYSPTKRQCYFDGEKPLKFFKIYTQSNCEVECLTEYTKAVCGCVKFSMPHSNDTQVCNTYHEVNCNINAQILFNIQNVSGNKKTTRYNLIGLETQFLNFTDAVGKKVQCNCLPACTSLQYDAEISQNPLNAEIMPYMGLTNDSLVSSINIFFKEDQFIAMERHELYGWADFIANSGGLVGFFMGFSVVSVIEIVYFVLLFKTNKNNPTAKFNQDSEKGSNKNKSFKIIQVSPVSDDWQKVPKFEYLP